MDYFDSFNTKQALHPAKGITVKSAHLDNVMMTYMEFAPDTDLTEHAHPHEQITMILHGKLLMTVDGRTKTMHKGDVVTIPPNKTHSAKSLEQPTIAVDAWSPPRKEYK